MDWERLRRSTNVQDRRGGGLGGGLAIGGGGALLIALVSLLFGANPADVLNQLGAGGSQSGGQYERTPENDRQADFAARILGSTEDVWSGIFQRSNKTYTPTQLVLFDGVDSSACGSANAATGPFYCPSDQDIYLDLSFFRQLEQLGGSGDFARAYVIAHEVGHHVQQELGIEQQVRSQQAGLSQAGANALSVRLELQADCFAGVWGHGASDIANLTDADYRQAINAAASIGDDRLSGGRATPDSFTHGSSQQRVTWFQRGLESGDPNKCDTFAQ
ncbi:KPN_02809 family neutral zinc metallopeptidase [Deinococcus yavapaiensis]|uniref:Metalloprotease n=1 Tax=Deinococcus yavapaiensis KR-236 TaxID=694435 RepID=A0A318S4H9_9DEIO|nr:neutral zinc metallopeptidase [Deinococcus yavapaiensis]PYE51880.1 hypothetical protein DES52_11481 [Deinococcus yavapaiensis KR-236]